MTGPTGEIVSGGLNANAISDTQAIANHPVTHGASSVTGLYRGPIIDAHCHLWDLGMNWHP